LRILLDTNVLLWWLADDARLSNVIRRTIREADAVFVSAVSAWEIEIKRATGKLSAPDNLERTIRDFNLSGLSVSVPHAIAAGRLPKHHRDPFDRMLIAQAKLESLTLVTSDVAFQAYDVAVMLL